MSTALSQQKNVLRLKELERVIVHGSYVALEAIAARVAVAAPEPFVVVVYAVRVQFLGVKNHGVDEAAVIECVAVTHDDHSPTRGTTQHGQYCEDFDRQCMAQMEMSSVTRKYWMLIQSGMVFSMVSKPYVPQYLPFLFSTLSAS